MTEIIHQSSQPKLWIIHPREYVRKPVEIVDNAQKTKEIP